MGAGGLGGFFGALLADAGEDVAFVARGAHLDALRKHGLWLESARGNVHIHPAKAADNAAEIGPVDTVLFTVKLWDTEAAAAVCAPLLGPETVVLTLQNGIETGDRLAALLGRERILAGVTYVPSVIARPGVIHHTGTAADITFGELDGQSTRRAKRLLAVLKGAGIAATLSDDIDAVLWKKFVLLVASSGVTAFTGLTYGPLRADAGARAMFHDAMAEAAAVARARGIVIADDFVPRGMDFLDAMPPEFTSSMAHDRRRGNRLEVEWLSGVVVRLGAEVGISTPVNAKIFKALR